MTIRVQCEPATFFIKEEGEKVLELKVDTDGRFTMASPSYSNTELLYGNNVEELLRRVRDIDKEREAKSNRLKALKEAGVNPIEALLVEDGGLTRIHVRGIDQRSNRVLITRHGGAKSQVRGEKVLRPLTPEERAEHDLAVKENLRLSNQVPKGRSSYGIHAEYDIEVTAQYDTKRTMFVASYAGHEFFGQTVPLLFKEVLQFVGSRDYPWCVTSADSVRPTDLTDLFGELFRSKEEADACAEARKRFKISTLECNELNKRYRLDLSVFGGDDE